VTEVFRHRPVADRLQLWPEDNTVQGVLTIYMQGETRERWEKLCQLAAEEQNPEELMRLVTEINRLLGEKEKRLTAQQQSNQGQN
jgi:hypothetical protein